MSGGGCAVAPGHARADEYVHRIDLADADATGKSVV